MRKSADGFGGGVAVIGGLLMIGVILLFVLLCRPAAASDAAPLSYTDLAGQPGLTIKIAAVDSCTGTPPAVTINPGVIGYTLTDAGSGRYYHGAVKSGRYHVFSSSVWKGWFQVWSDSLGQRISAIEQNSWVTNDRIATGAVTSAKILNGEVLLVDLASNSVDALKVVDGSLNWADMHANFVGTGPSQTFPIKAMQDTIRAMRGNWNPATDYNLDVLDSLMKTRVLGLTFATPCTVRIGVASRQFGVRAMWQMNTTHNDSSVEYYEVRYMVDAAPAFYTAGEQNAADLESLRNQTDGFYVPRGARAYNISWPLGGRVYVVVLAKDWGGTFWGSRWDSASVLTDTDIGSMSTLIGAPGFAAGMSLTQTLRDMLNDVAVLQEGLGGLAGQTRMTIYADRQLAGTAIGDAANPLSEWLETTTFAVKVKLRQTFVKPDGFNQLQLYGQLRCKSFGEAAMVTLVAGGATIVYKHGGLGTAVDTTWTAFTLTVPLTGVSAGVPAMAEVFLYAASSGDSAYMRYPVVWLVK